MLASLKWHPLFLQLIRFGITGGCAAVVHFSTVIALVELGRWHPLDANIIAFLCSFMVSFTGHRLWTFADTTVALKQQLPTFFITAAAGFLLNQSLFYLLLYHALLNYVIALILAIGISSAAIFIISKQVVFRT